jgi:hypothetical protein
LIEAAATGAVDPLKANDQNRKLTAGIQAGTARVDDLRAIVAAETTATLGGQVKLPLEDYPKRLDFDAATDLKLPRRKWTPLEKNLFTGAVMLALVLGTVFGLAIARSTVRAGFSVSAHEMQTGFIRVQCKNTGNRPVEFYTPWPNGQPRAPQGAKGANRSFGVVLSVREKPGGEFRAYEGAAGAWKFRGAYVDEGTPVEVAPGVTESVFLDLNRLREQGLTMDALAFEFTKNGGGELHREEVRLEP